MKVLAGDIGGTKTLVAIADVRGRDVALLREQRFASQDYPGIAPIVREFLRDDADIHRAGFGVAGPVVGDRSQITKLPWELSVPNLVRELGLDRVALINDFAAIALGIDALRPDELETLHAAERDPEGPVAVLGAGTGLGEALRIHVDGKPVAIASEGGHKDFAPRNEIEFDLVRHLTNKYGRASYDRVLSGPGLADIYNFLRDTGRAFESREASDAIAATDDPAPVITRLADEKRDPLCEATLDLFVSVYAAEAGNLALAVVATGGVFVAGGIAPRIVDRLQTGAFETHYLAKGRLSPVVERLPAYVITNPKVGLLGACIAAATA